MPFLAFIAAAVCLLSIQSDPLSVLAANQTDYYNLVSELFDTGYRNVVRPTSNGETTYVFVSVYLLSILDLQEKNQELYSSVTLDFLWSDDYLSWSPDLHNNITSMLFPQKYLWLPDIVIANSVQSEKQMGYPEATVRIDNFGSVNWKPSEVLITSCDLDVTYFPFDYQTCSIIISTKMSTLDDIDLDLDRTEPVLLNRYNPSGSWKLLTVTVEELSNEENLTRLKFNIKLKRLRTFYVMNVLLPILFLSCTASMAFYLPSDSGEKMGVSITVLLSYAVYLSVVADTMPNTSLQVSLMSVYLNLLLGVSAMSVIMTVVVLHIHHKSEEVDIGPGTLSLVRKGRQFFGLNTNTGKPVGRQIKVVTLHSTTDHMTESTDGPGLADTLQEQERRATRKSAQNVVSPNDLRADLKSSKNSLATLSDGQEEVITWRKVAELLDYVIFTFLSILILLLTCIAMTVIGVLAARDE